MTSKTRVTEWENRCEEALLGATISAVRYMTEEEAEEFMWNDRPLIIDLRKPDGTTIQLIPSADDEGNNGGAIFTSLEGLPTIPVV